MCKWKTHCGHIVSFHPSVFPMRVLFSCQICLYGIWWDGSLGFGNPDVLILSQNTFSLFNSEYHSSVGSVPCLRLSILLPTWAGRNVCVTVKSGGKKGAILASTFCSKCSSEKRMMFSRSLLVVALPFISGWNSVFAALSCGYQKWSSGFKEVLLRELHEPL